MKQKRLNLINVSLVLLVLAFVSMLIMGSTNSWFTIEHKNLLNMTVSINNLNLAVFQESRELTTGSSYIEYQGEIQPDSIANLNLILKNNDQTAETSLCIRYKINLYANVDGGNLEIPITLSGQDTTFVSGGDGYYYWGAKANKTPFAKGTSANLLTGFSYSFEDFINNNLNGNNFKLSLTVEASPDGVWA